MIAFDPSRGGMLGVTPILWSYKGQYAWSEQFEEEYPDWDQCCSGHVEAVSQSEAKVKALNSFKTPSVIPIAIKDITPVRYVDIIQ